MEVLQEKKDAQSAVLKVVVGPEDYVEKVNKTLRDYRKKAALPGFRAGMVPTSVIRKMYGKALIAKELNDLVTKSLNQYIAENKLNLVGEPLPITEDIGLDSEISKNYELEYEIGFAPEIEPDFNLKTAPVKYSVLIDEETLDKEMSGLAKRFGEMTNPEEAVEGDTLFGKLFEINAEGQEIANGFQRMFALNPEHVVSKEIPAMVAGKKIGDRFNLTMGEILEPESHRKFWENNVSGEKVKEITDDMLEAIRSKTFAFEVKKINHVEPAELNQALFEKIFPAGEVNSLEEFREKRKQDVQKYFDDNAQKYFRSQVINGMLEANEIPLPDDFLKRSIAHSSEGEDAGKLERVENAYGEYRDKLRWTLLVNRLRRDPEFIDVNDDDIRARAIRQVETELKPYLPTINEDQVVSYAANMLKDEKAANRIFSEVLEDRLVDFLSRKINVVENEMTSTEFIEMISNDKK